MLSHFVIAQGFRAFGFSGCDYLDRHAQRTKFDHFSVFLAVGIGCGLKEEVAAYPDLIGLEIHEIIVHKELPFPIDQSAISSFCSASFKKASLKL